ncbi:MULTISPECIES: hypothetical protein [Peribacillus]|uniref:hypothetical protein n=1 Tax=Peribacillus TaxID=2675229 RepID=UPI00203C7420|nr:MULTISPECIES: hypothetical protein [Peribacillus]MCM3675884.1 hypothetical protein [Peribacillus simplex]
MGPYITGLFVKKSVTAAAGFQYFLFMCAGLLFVFGLTAYIGIRPKRNPAPEVSGTTAV